MIEAASFPGWENLAAMLSHLRFVRPITIGGSDASPWSRTTRCSPRRQKIASYFVSAELRTFDAAGRAAALAWLEAGPQTSE